MKEESSQKKNPMSRSGWATLGAVILLLIWGAGTTVFYFNMPTDGWLSKQSVGTDSSETLYIQNVAGVPSGLRPGDRVVAIEGVGINSISVHNPDINLKNLSEKWKDGNTLQYTVLRNRVTQVVEVPLVFWSFWQGLQLWIRSDGNVGGIVGQILFLAIAALTFIKRPTDHAAHTLLLFAAMIFPFGSTVLLYTTGLAVNFFPAATMITLATVATSYTILLPPTLLRFALVFPHPKPFVQRHPLLEAAPYLIGLALIPLFIITNGIAGYAWTILSVAASIVILIHSAFTMRDALSRAQLLWGLWGVVLGLLMELSSFLVTFNFVGGVAAGIINVLASLSFGILGITLSIAVLRYRLFDINVIIRRTLVYGALTLALGLAYFGSVVILRQLLGRFTSQSQIAIVLSTLLIAVLFTPLKVWLQTWIDRRFYREKYNADQALEFFSSVARNEVELEELSRHLTGVVVQTVQPAQVSLWMRTVAPIQAAQKKDQD